MTEPIQCDNCGAVLLEEDVFCGECGAPRPSLAEAAQPAAGQPVAGQPAAQEPSASQPRPAPPPPAPPQPAGRSASSTAGWRVSVVILGILAAGLCLLGLVGFLLFGLTESESFTPQENWLFATFCCLLPIAGTGVIVAVAAVGIWFTRLRNR